MNLLDLARRDADDWIETVSNMYRDFPSRRCVIPLPSDPNSYFCRTLDELKKAGSFISVLVFLLDDEVFYSFI